LGLHRALRTRSFSVYYAFRVLCTDMRPCTGRALVRVAWGNGGPVGTQGPANCCNMLRLIVRIIAKRVNLHTNSFDMTCYCSDPPDTVRQVVRQRPASESSLGDLGSLKPTIYKYIFFRPDRGQHIVHRRGYSQKTTKTLEEALAVPMELFECSQADLLRVSATGVKRRPAATGHAVVSFLGSESSSAAAGLQDGKSPEGSDSVLVALASCTRMSRAGTCVGSFVWGDLSGQ